MIMKSPQPFAWESTIGLYSHLHRKKPNFPTNYCASLILNHGSRSLTEDQLLTAHRTVNCSSVSVLLKKWNSPFINCVICGETPA